MACLGAYIREGPDRSGLSRPPPAIMGPMSLQMTTLRFTAECSPSQHRRLDEILAVSCEMYNALLESWKGTYAWRREHNPGAEQFPADRNGRPDDLSEKPCLHGSSTQRYKTHMKPLIQDRSLPANRIAPPPR